VLGAVALDVVVRHATIGLTFTRPRPASHSTGRAPPGWATPPAETRCLAEKLADTPQAELRALFDRL
jgi:hypothetical protein